MRGFATCLLLTALAGCDLFPSGAAPDPGDTQPPEQQTPGSDPAPANVDELDGNWRHAAVGSLPETCLTIQNHRIAQLDVGCDGNLLFIFNAPGARIFGSDVTHYATAGESSTDTVNWASYTYRLTIQSDGTMPGTASTRFRPSGPVYVEEIVLVRE